MRKPPADCRPTSDLRQPRAVHAAILLVTSGLTPLATAVLGPSLPKMQAHFASTPGADFLVPLVLTAPMLVMAVLSVVAGALADRLGRKRILVWSTALYAVFGTAPLWLQTLPAIFGSRIFMGITEAALMTVSTTMIGDYYAGRRRQRFMSLQTTVAAGAAFVLNLLGGALGEHGWRTPYAVYVVSLPLAAMMVVYLWEPTAHTASAHRCESMEDEAIVVFDPRQLLTICAIAFFVGIVFLIVPVHLGYLFTSIGVTSSGAIGLAYGLNSLGVVAGTVGFGWFLANRLDVAGQLAVGVAITAAGCIGLALATSFAAVTAAAIVNGVGAGLLLPTATTWNMRALPLSRRGFGVGAFQSSLFLGMFLNPIVVVGLDKLLHTRTAAVGIIGSVMSVSAFIAWAVALRKPVRSRRLNRARLLRD